MRPHGLHIFILLAALAAPAAALDIPKEPADDGAVTRMPLAPASITALVLRALPKGVAARNDIMIQSEVLAEKTGPVRLYPVVGAARLVSTHYKCTVFSGKRIEIVYIDHERLKPARE